MLATLILQRFLVKNTSQRKIIDVLLKVRKFNRRNELGHVILL